jgi:hypothetical protein
VRWTKHWAIEPEGLAVESTIIEELRARFNEAAGSVRLISFLSPTWGACRYGQGLVRALFEEFPDKNLAGFIVWVPMLPEDSPARAAAEQSAITDPRLRCWYDADRDAANTWSALIGLPVTTWDVYAVYDEAVTWLDGQPLPPPRIWMHQLDETAATQGKDRLDPVRLAGEWLRLLGEDVGRNRELSLKLDARGRAVSARTGPARW